MGGMLMATQSPRVVLPTTIILALLDIFAVFLRFYARNRKKHRLLADDWLTIPALVLNIGLATTLLHGVAKHVYGYPTPVPTGTPLASRLNRRTSWAEINDNITIAKKDEWTFLLISIPALGCIKLSILFFYQRLFVMSKRDWRNSMNLSLWVMIVLVSMWAIAFFLRYLFACGVHFDIWWTNAKNIMTMCGDFNKILNALAISDFAFDVLVLVFPLPIVWRLHMRTSQKVAVSFVFAIGSFAVVASLVRMIWVVWQAKQNFNPELDVDLLITTFLFWNYLEATVGLLAACIPTLRGFIKTSSFDSVIRSVRTRISLDSLPSLVTFTRRSNSQHDEDLSLRSGDRKTERPSESSGMPERVPQSNSLSHELV